MIGRAIYGGKSAGKDFRYLLLSCMCHLDFASRPVDPDVWMTPIKRSDGPDCYEYALLYTDDTLVIIENAEQVLQNEHCRYFTLIEESIRLPNIYIGGHM